MHYSPSLLLIHKPVGPTSFDVLRTLKKALPRGYGKIGHFGTLDPFAAGVLVVGVAGATRLMEWGEQFLSPKVYRATGCLGVKTASGDCTDPVVEEQNIDQIRHFQAVQVETLWQQALVGPYAQRPPLFSAVKVGGRPSYDYARSGEALAPHAPVLRTLFGLQVESYAPPEVNFLASVSTGTYIRTLFEDMAAKLGTIGHLTALTRVACGPNALLERAIPYEQLEGRSEDFWQQALISVTQIFTFPSVVVDQSVAQKFLNGSPIDVVASDGHVWIFFEQRLLGLATVSGPAQVRPIIVWNSVAV